MKLFFKVPRPLLAIFFLLIVAPTLSATVHDFELPGRGLVQGQIIEITEEAVTFQVAATGEQIIVPAGDFRSGYLEFLKFRYQLEQANAEAGEAPNLEELLQQAESEESDQVDPAGFRTWRLASEATARIGAETVEARLLELVTGQVKLEDRAGKTATLPFSDLAPEEMSFLQSWFLKEQASRMDYFSLRVSPLIRDFPPTNVPGLPFSEVTDLANPDAKEGAFSEPEGTIQKSEFGWYEVNFTSRAPIPLQDFKVVIYLVKKRSAPGVDSYYALEQTWKEDRVERQMTPFRTHGLPIFESEIRLEGDRANKLLPRKVNESLFGVIAKVYAGDQLIHLHVDPQSLFRETEWETPYPLEPPTKLVIPTTSGEAEFLSKYLPTPADVVAPEAEAEKSGDEKKSEEGADPKPAK